MDFALWGEFALDGGHEMPNGIFGQDSDIFQRVMVCNALDDSFLTLSSTLKEEHMC